MSHPRVILRHPARPLASAVAVLLALVLTGCDGLGASLRPAVEIVAVDFDTAYGFGRDHQGKTREQYLLQIEGRRVRVLRPIIVGKDTTGQNWTLLIGDHLACYQSSREAKEMVANLRTSEPGQLTGQYDRVLASGVVVLENCRID